MLQPANVQGKSGIVLFGSNYMCVKSCFSDPIEGLRPSSTPNPACPAIVSESREPLSTSSQAKFSFDTEGPHRSCFFSCRRCARHVCSRLFLCRLPAGHLSACPGSPGRSLHSRPDRCLHQSFSAPMQYTPRRGLPLLTWLLCVAIAAAAAMDMDVCCAYFCTGLSVFGVIALVRCHSPSTRAAPSRNARSPHAYRGVQVPPAAGRLIPAAPLPVAALLVRRSHFRW